MGASPDRLLAGEVGKPHGLGGEVYVVRISDDPSRFEPGARLQREDGSELHVHSARSHRTRFLVRFQGVDSRAEAEDLRGPLYVRPDDLRDLEPDEYWEHQLIGCTALDSSGAVIGTVSRIVPGAAQDLLELETERGIRLVPLVRAIVLEVDPAGRRVVVDPPEGLLE